MPLMRSYGRRGTVDRVRIVLRVLKLALRNRRMPDAARPIAKLIEFEDRDRVYQVIGGEQQQSDPGRVLGINGKVVGLGSSDSRHAERSRRAVRGGPGRSHQLCQSRIRGPHCAPPEMGLVPAEKAGGNELTLRGRTLQRWPQKPLYTQNPRLGIKK